MNQATRIEVNTDQTHKDAMYVAFATSNMNDVDKHFGSAAEFMVYEVHPKGYSVHHIVKTDTSNFEGDDKTDFKVKALSGVNIMYSQSIGGTAAAKVIRAGITPMKVDAVKPIEDILKDLVFMLNSNPPPWIRQITNMPITNDARRARWAN